MATFAKIREFIENANNIAIFVHMNPDGDCLGSAKAVQEYLKSISKNADIFCNDEIPDYLKFLNIENKIDSLSLPTYDLSIALDCSDSKRMGRCMPLFYKSKMTLCIDHHTDYTVFAKYSMNMAGTSSTGLIIYNYLKYIKFNFTNEVCEALYTAIACDTGAFIHSMTTGNDHRAVAYLMDNSTVDFDALNYRLFKSKSLISVLLLQRALQHMKFYRDGDLLLTYIKKSDLNELNAVEDDTSSIVGFINGIQEIKCAIILLQRDEEEFRVSIRSKEDYASRIAQKFGGGGHLQAAGCRVYGTLEDCIQQLIDASMNVL